MITNETKSLPKPDCFDCWLENETVCERYAKNESSRIQLLRFTRIHLKTEGETLEWTINDKSRSIGDSNQNNHD